MNKFIPAFALLLIVGLLFSFRPAAKIAAPAKAVKWYTFEEAVALSQKNPKKMFIDVYTDWCGWCKRMDNTTFTDARVAAYLNENFYPVKFNAEQKDKVEFRGHTLKFLAEASRRGVHELAYALLDGRLGYPAFVYLDGKQDRISISPGYKEADALLVELEFVDKELYKSMTFEDYKANRAAEAPSKEDNEREKKAAGTNAGQ